jgi:hypothetical protein
MVGCGRGGVKPIKAKLEDLKFDLKSIALLL